VRRADRRIESPEEIERILSEAKVMHLGLIDEGRPYVVPLHYGYKLSDEALTLYAHGAREGRKLDVIRANGTAFVELECDVSIVSGGDVPCRYGSYYASVMGQGEASVVEDVREKILGIELLMRNQTQRDFEVTPAMAGAVAVVKVVVPRGSLSAKGRMMPR
jgi:nitroimidazol reductase NimA-like FMN-containing flavoprotein (pyridoxamine 5'-phosphate oxidase superfamily)